MLTVAYNKCSIIIVAVTIFAGFVIILIQSDRHRMNLHMRYEG